MRVLICGGRDFSNVAFIWSRLDRLHNKNPFTAIITGGYRGVDTIASEWAATKHGIKRYVCKAEWTKYGPAAGPLRNARMLEWKPDLVVAFPGGNGTSDMKAKSTAAGIPIEEPF